MKKTLGLKRVMISYLDTMYPEIYLLELKQLGDVVDTFNKDAQGNWFDDRRVGRSRNSWFDLRKEIISILELTFSVNYITADSVVNDWVNCRPKYKYVRNSMNEQVLVRVTEECGMTL